VKYTQRSGAVIVESETSTLEPVAKRNWLRRLWPLWLVVGLFALLYLFTGSRGGIVQFNPHTLQSRWQREITIGFGTIPIYRSAFQYNQRPMVRELMNRGLVAPVEDHGHWEMISHWNTAWKDGDGFWYDVLTRNRVRLLEWSDTSPEFAKLYWSEAFGYLRSEYEMDRITGQLLLQAEWRIKNEASLRAIIYQLRLEAYQSASNADSPADRAYAEAEYQKLSPRNSGQ